MAQILINRIRTPDGTVLESKHRHDYVEHVDANGKTYALSGGTDYQRIVGEFTDCVDLSVYDYSSHNIIREEFKWTTYGPNGDQPRTEVLLKNMSTDHIHNILNDNFTVDYITKILQDELLFRQG